MGCEVCEFNKENGWTGQSGVAHCRDCHRDWKSKSQGHCSGCHRQFGGSAAFDRHFKRGAGVACYSERSLPRRGLVKREDAYGFVWGSAAPEAFAKDKEKKA